jgi:hypothetical protein
VINAKFDVTASPVEKAYDMPPISGGAVRTVGITWITQPFVERFQAHLGVFRYDAMWTFWLEPVSRRMCIWQRIEWDGLLLGSDHEELLAMTVADL